MGKQKSSNGIIALLVLIVIILSVLIVLTGTGVISFKNNSSDDVQISDDSNVSSNKISDLSTSDNLYSVVDINDDDIPELFIYVTGVVGNQIIADTSIYTYDENKGNEDNNYIVFVGSVSGRIDNNTILYKMNDGKLLSVFGHMGYESIAYYELKNDWLVRTEFSSKETNDYMTGDTEIQFVSCDDTSLIDNYR